MKQRTEIDLSILLLPYDLPVQEAIKCVTKHKNDHRILNLTFDVVNNKPVFGTSFSQLMRCGRGRRDKIPAGTWCVYAPSLLKQLPCPHGLHITPQLRSFLMLDTLNEKETVHPQLCRVSAIL